jgi:hypothetical protein
MVTGDVTCSKTRLVSWPKRSLDAIERKARDAKLAQEQREREQALKEAQAAQELQNRARQHSIDKADGMCAFSLPALPLSSFTTKLFT